MTTQTWHDVRSSALGMATTLTVITPKAMEHPGLLILLHGLTGNHAVWPIRTDLQTLADRHQLVIALPDGQRSFWIDQARGLRWGLWVGSELPGLLRETLRISREREDTLVQFGTSTSSLESCVFVAIPLLTGVPKTSQVWG